MNFSRVASGCRPSSAAEHALPRRVDGRMLKLTHEMTFHLTVSGPLGSTKGAPAGERVYWEMTSGTLHGPRIRAEIARPGSDWMHASPDGFWRPDVHIAFITDDGALVLLHYTGLVQQTD